MPTYCCCSGTGRNELSKQKEPAVRGHAQERRHVAVVGQRRRNAHQAHALLAQLLRAQRARDDGFEHRATLVVQQVDLVHDDQPHELRVGTLAGLARHDVPLFRRRHDDLRLGDLGARQLLVAAQLAHDEVVRARAEPLGKVAHHFLHQRLHGRDVDYLEALLERRRVDLPVRANELGDLVQHAQHGHVGLACACRRAHEQVDVLVERRRADAALHAVQHRHALEARLRPLRQ